MIQYIMLIIAFISLYTTILWLSFLYLGNFDRKKSRIGEYPLVTIAIPAHNEEKGIRQTIQSVLDMKYPEDKLELIVINDASTDNTKEIAEEIISQNRSRDIKLLNTKECYGKKSPGMNRALRIAKGEFFGCVDADSIVDKNALHPMLPHFSERKVGAVISAIQVNDPKNIYEKIQHFEYIMGILTRKLMASIGTLVMTPGVLSIYRTDVLKIVGGFDENNITEDFEIALRLKDAGYCVELETDSHTFTNVPNNFRSLWNQRIRWFRGFIENHRKYKHMILNREFKTYGMFQIPFNILSVPILILSAGLIFYGFMKYSYEFILRSVVITNYFKNSILHIPSLKEILLLQNLKIGIPILFASVLGIIMIVYAYRQVNQKLKNPAHIWVYFVIFPYLTSLHWLSAIGQEILKIRKKW